MTDSRKQILGRLPRSGSNHPCEDNPRPASVVETGRLVEQLQAKLEAVHASVDIIDSDAQAATSIDRFLKLNQCSPKIAITPAIDTLDLPFPDRVELCRDQDYSGTQTAITHALLGVAETGSLVLPSSPQRPTLANFLPDNCIVILEQGDIVAWLEDALAQIQEQAPGMPRALNLISGPSKTADIEQTLVYGAHGPIRLHVIIRRSE